MGYAIGDRIRVTGFHHGTSAAGHQIVPGDTGTVVAINPAVTLLGVDFDKGPKSIGVYEDECEAE